MRYFYTTLPPHYPARAARQWNRPSIPSEYPVPPSIPPERLASGSRRVSRQSGSPVDFEYPARAARQWIPLSIPPERLGSGFRRVSRQSGSPVDLEYPARAARQWIPPSILPERLASGSCQVYYQSSPPVDPAEYPAEYPRVAQWIPPSIPASGSRRVSRSFVQHLSVDPASIPLEQLASLVLLNVQKGRWEFGVEVSRVWRNLL